MTLTGDLVSGQPVSFRRLRQAFEDTALQEGVLGAGDLKVGQRGAGANMSVDVAAGQAWISVDTGALNGLSHATSDAVENRAVPASNGTNPRVDQVILRYNDTSIPTGSGNTPTVEVLAGTATAGATLDNRNGAVALPADAIRLVDMLVPAASASVTTANMRDRRPWARGGFRTRRVNSGADASYGGAIGPIDSTNLRIVLECSGVPVDLRLFGHFGRGAAGGPIYIGFAARDAAQVVVERTADQASATGGVWIASTAMTTVVALIWTFVPPSPGRYFLDPEYGSDGLQPVLWYHGATRPTVFSVAEHVRPSADNA